MNRNRGETAEKYWNRDVIRIRNFVIVNFAEIMK